MAINIKLTKFDNTPWGFRLAGGSDFPHPLTVIKVAEESLAECMGLKVGDVVVRLNEAPISNLTHGEAHEALILAGNNFTLGVHRQVFRDVRTALTAVRHNTIFTEEDPLKAVEAISEENIVPYKAPLPPVYPENILLEEPTPEKTEEETEVKCENIVDNDVKPEDEIADKPIDPNSEIPPNQNLTDDEIAQLILEEEELIVPEQGVLGVNFKKLRPRLPNLKQSKVVEELQSLATEDPPRVKERKHVSTFLQKPQRPIPTPRDKKQEEPEVPPAESYRVVIKKQEKKSVTKRLLEKGLLHPGPVPTPEYRSEVNMFLPSYDDIHTGSANGKNDRVADEAVKAGETVVPSPSFAKSNGFVEVFVKDESTPRDSAISPQSPTSTKNAKLFAKRRSFRGRYFVKTIRWYRDFIVHFLKFIITNLLGHRKEESWKKRVWVKPHYFERNVRRCWKLCLNFCALREEHSVNRKFYFRGRYYKKCFRWYRDSCLNLLKLSLAVALAHKRVKIVKSKFIFKGHYFRRNLYCYRESCLRFLKLLRGCTRRESVRRPSMKMKGHYLETCLRRDSFSSVWALKAFFDEEDPTNRFSVGFSSTGSYSRRSSCAKAHYGERILTRNIKNIGNCLNPDALTDLSNFGKAPSSRRNSCVRAHYAERVMVGYLESLGLFMGGLLFQICESPENSTTFNAAFSQGSGHHRFFFAFAKIVSSEIFHRGNRKVVRLQKITRILKPRPAVNILNPDFDIETAAVNNHSLFKEWNESKSNGDILNIKSESVGFGQCVGKKESILKVRTEFVKPEKDSVENQEVLKSNSTPGELDEDRKQNGDEETNVECEEFIQTREEFLLGKEKDQKSYDISAIELDDSDQISGELIPDESSEISGDIAARLGSRNSLSESKEPETVQTGNKSETSFSSDSSCEMSGKSKEKSVNDLLRSTKDFISVEVFHRGSRRLSRSSRGSIFSSTGQQKEYRKFENSDGKNVESLGKKEEEFDRECRRLSFVPTILYEGITNRIGIDFTKLFVYAFVPCMSVVLLYMYKHQYKETNIDVTVY